MSAASLRRFRRLRRLLKYWSGPRCCGFWRWPRRERSADIRCDLGQASNAGSAPKLTQPFGREAEGVAGCGAPSLQPATGMRLSRSLPSTPSASARDPLQYFNSLLGIGRLLCFEEIQSRLQKNVASVALLCDLVAHLDHWREFSSAPREDLVPPALLAVWCHLCDVGG